MHISAEWLPTRLFNDGYRK